MPIPAHTRRRCANTTGCTELTSTAHALTVIGPPMPHGRPPVAGIISPATPLLVIVVGVTTRLLATRSPSRKLRGSMVTWLGAPIVHVHTMLETLATLHCAGMSSDKARVSKTSCVATAANKKERSRSPRNIAITRSQSGRGISTNLLYVRFVTALYPRVYLRKPISAKLVAMHLL